MPIYMDRHDVSETVTAENVAQLHQQDLKIQHQFSCRGLTYWFDDKRKTAFCLIEAPDEQAIHDMHKQAHGEVPHRVIEVDPNIVESFLGRIEDPENTQDTELNIISDPAFRALMVIDLVYYSLKELDAKQLKGFAQRYYQSVSQIIHECKGRVVEHQTDYMLVSFKSISEAIICAKTIHFAFQSLIPEHQLDTQIKIGISAGVPVTKENIIFEKAIRTANRMCQINKADIVVSSEVKELATSENVKDISGDNSFYFLTPSEEYFLNTIMNFIESKWTDEQVSVDDFNLLGFSKSQLYRKITELTGKSPSSFLKEYRLKKSLQLLRKNDPNVSEISTMVGFNSPSYFSKCFKKKYLISPSDYIPSLS
jgi:AraC-like DNA-binding protein